MGPAASAWGWLTMNSRKRVSHSGWFTKMWMNSSGTACHAVVSLKGKGGRGERRGGWGREGKGEEGRGKGGVREGRGGDADEILHVQIGFGYLACGQILASTRKGGRGWEKSKGERERRERQSTFASPTGVLASNER